MTGAMSSAIAGLKAHMDKLNVIGNNVANVNTVGYKPGRVLFMDSIYTTMTTGSNGTTTVGGRNPSQIGYGASIGSIDGHGHWYFYRYWLGLGYHDQRRRVLPGGR